MGAWRAGGKNVKDGLSYTITLESNAPIVRAELPKAIEKCLYAMGVKAVEGAVTSISGRYTVSNQAVDTGRLRASISFITAGGQSGESSNWSANSQSGDKLTGKAEPNSVIVGSNVDYAEYVHDGTSRMGGRPFLREGIDRTKAEMEQLVKGVLEGKY